MNGFYRFRYLPSTADVTQFLLCNLGLLFVCKKIETLIFLKIVGKKKKNAYIGQLLKSLIFVKRWHHYESCISWHWPTFSRLKFWNINTSETELAQKLEITLNSTYFNIFFSKMQMITKLLLKICLNLHDTCRWVAHVAIGLLTRWSRVLYPQLDFIAERTRVTRWLIFNL